MRRPRLPTHAVLALTLLFILPCSSALAQGGTPSNTDNPAARDKRTTARGESVASLANALYPDDSTARSAFTAFVLRNNPTVFDAIDGDAATSELPAGTELIIPTPGQVVIAASRRAEQPASGTAAQRPATDRPSERLAMREAKLVRGIEQSLDTQAALEERLRLLEHIRHTLQSQLAAEKLQPVVAAAPSAATDEASPRSEPSALAASDEGWRTWLLLIAAALLGFALIHRLTAARTRPADTDASAPVRRIHNTASPVPGAATDEAGGRGPTPSDLPGPAADDTEGHAAAIELADIMESFGRTHGAAETLADYVREHPRQSVAPWLKLLTLYHKTGRREEFDQLAHELNRTFNVSVITWENFGDAHSADTELEDFPHIVRALVAQWRTRGCQAYIDRLLRDNRGGSREGFPLGIIDELLLLSAMLEQEIGRHHAGE